MTSSIFSEEKAKLKKELVAYLKLKVIPGAVKTEPKERLEDGTIKMGVKGKAEKGEANRCLTQYLAKEFSVDKTEISIISGQASRGKLIRIKKK
jgi:uncharacterized protein YggU (UPF0235/DUF167 family)